jgi:alpha-mannosidase
MEGQGSRGAENDLQPVFISVDRPNVVIETIKQAQDRQGVIVRLYESQRCRGRVTLTIGSTLAKAWRTNLLEENQERLACTHNSIVVHVNPYQVVTLRLMPVTNGR